ncbi:hypothetical protein [Bradyrhizobium sp. USDA 3650]
MSMSSKKTQSSVVGQPETTYVPPYSILLDSLGVGTLSDTTRLSVSGKDVREMIRHLLKGVPVSETWYRRTYPDVDEAIQSGDYKSAKHHFVENGYFEGRRPGPVAVDEDWYLSTYPDVAHGIESGEISSPQQHFLTHGYAEGRLPRDF